MKYRLMAPDVFKKRFRITQKRFEKIRKRLKWKQKFDAAGKAGVHPTLKIMIALKQLVEGRCAAWLVDEFDVGETTADQCLRSFCTDMIKKYGKRYLAPRFEKSLASAEKRGVKGYLGSLDCTHIVWHGCPRAHAGSHKDRSGHLSLILEALVDSDLRCTHFYFGMPGGSNDINVFKGSPLIRLTQKL